MNFLKMNKTNKNNKNIFLIPVINKRRPDFAELIKNSILHTMIDKEHLFKKFLFQKIFSDSSSLSKLFYSREQSWSIIHIPPSNVL